MLASLILLFSAVLLGWYARRYRRALLSVAARADLATALPLAGFTSKELDTDAYHLVMNLEAMCPVLEDEPLGLRAVRFYSALLRRLRRLTARHAPAICDWAMRERHACFRYAVVQLSQRVERNRETVAEIRSL
jgi:hypothetical protein